MAQPGTTTVRLRLDTSSFRKELEGIDLAARRLLTVIAQCSRALDRHFDLVEEDRPEREPEPAVASVEEAGIKVGPPPYEMVHVQWCTQHDSFQVNEDTCWQWEMLLSESNSPQTMDVDCRLGPAVVVRSP